MSLFGLSYVSVYFADDMDVYFARQLANERLQEVGDRIPAGYGRPEMGPNTSGLGQVLWYTLERSDAKLKDQITDMDLRTLQDWTVRLILRTAPGVDDVSSWGGGERQYQVRIDPLKLIKHQLGFKDVIGALRSQQRSGRRQFHRCGPRAIPRARSWPRHQHRGHRSHRAEDRRRHTGVRPRRGAGRGSPGTSIWRRHARRRRSRARHGAGPHRRECKERRRRGQDETWTSSAPRCRKASR